MATVLLEFHPICKKVPHNKINHVLFTMMRKAVELFKIVYIILPISSLVNMCQHKPNYPELLAMANF